ncbi:Uncharacterized protein Rs2_18079 [Raphanus sativus]|uniref:Uncharacterized protein LOC108854346 n=1 Tax=Raphanus sativus TaxID=3726 RepID=A0A6J0NFV3_RAPSA|nr:uncharacterized protein LOC108854346 [Raphanus sativus]KAJ4904128.1 Uncharacterized protein Rs2_18079 [Raphanus sativus]
MTEKPDDEGKKANAEGGTQGEGGSKMTEVKKPDDEGKKTNAAQGEGGSKMTEVKKPDDEGNAEGGPKMTEAKKPDDEGNAEGGTQEEGESIQKAVRLIFTARFDQIFRYIGHKLPATQTYLQGTSNLLDRSVTKTTTTFAGRRVVPPRVVTGNKGASMRLGAYAGSVAAWFVCRHAKDIVVHFFGSHKKKKEKQLLEKQRAEYEMEKSARRAEKEETMSALVNDVTVLQREVKELNEWKVGVVRAFSSSHRSLINRNTLTTGQIANEEIRKARNYFAQRRF